MGRFMYAGISVVGRCGYVCIGMRVVTMLDWEVVRAWWCIALVGWSGVEFKRVLSDDGMANYCCVGEAREDIPFKVRRAVNC